MSNRTIKASMIDDADILWRIVHFSGSDLPLPQLWPGTLIFRQPFPHWTQMWDLEEMYPDIPSKVINAKAGQLIKRGLLDGCACGCRGDFEITRKGMDWLMK